MPETESARLVQSTSTSLRILDAVHELEGARLTDVANELDIGHSTAHNHLATLSERGWLVRDGGVYHISLRFLHFGRSARRRTPSFDTVRRHVVDLANETNLEVEYLVEDGGRIISIIDIGPDTGMRGPISEHWQGVGIYYHMTNTASGKAILAELPESRVEAVLDRWGLPARTPYSVTDRETLHEQLEATRERGYAEAQQEFQEGFENVAAALDGPDGEVYGAISVGWPVYLFDDGIERDVVDLLLEAEASIEAALRESDED